MGHYIIKLKWTIATESWRDCQALTTSYLFFPQGLATCKSELPSFTWSSETTPFGVPLLRVAFPDEGQDDFAVLRSFNPVPLAAHERAEDLDSCIYEGYLLNEKDVHVTVTGCALSDNLQVIILCLGTDCAKTSWNFRFEL